MEQRGDSGDEVGDAGHTVGGDEWPCRRFLLGGSIQVFFLFWEFCSCAYRGFSEMGTIQRDSRGLRTGCHDLSSS